MDFSNAEHILYFGIYCAVMSAVALFLFVTAFVVMGKGKRRCGALDVTFRIFAVVSIIASAALLASSVLISLDGAYRIEVGESAVLMLGETTVALPVYGLFVALSAVGMTELNAAVLLLSIVALAADCLLANVKGDKKAKAHSTKTEAQAKRVADIERIRRIADAAVHKSESACGSAEKPTDPVKPAEDDDNDFDWRVDPEERKTAFVGLNAADAADDVFGDDDGEQTSVVSETDDSAGKSDFELDEVDANDIDGVTDDEKQPDGVTAEDNDGVDSDRGGDIDYGDGEPDASFGGFEPDDAFSFDPASVTDDADDHIDAEQSGGESVTELVRFDIDGGDVDAEKDADNDGGEFEPNRDIYIPRIRTIVRKPAPAAVKRDAEQKPKKRAATAGGKSKTGGGRQTASKQPAKKRGANGAANVKPSVKNKTLPVTKRYVILDRTSAVNVFSEYLKERDKADKDRLESNIETIIIK